MDIDRIEIRSKARKFIIDELDGFDEFENCDSLVDMGIVTEDFVFSLMQFIEKDFNITISDNDGECFYKNNLSVTSIAKFVEKKMKQKNDLISEIMMCFVSIVGTQVLPIDVDFLEKLPYWNDDLEEEFKDQLFEKFNIDMDLSKMKPLTFSKIADYIMQKQTRGLKRSGSDVKEEPEENETPDFQLFKMVNG